jgi:hypothetical protein
MEPPLQLINGSLIINQINSRESQEGREICPGGEWKKEEKDKS